MYQNGSIQKDIAIKYNITLERARQIVHKESRKQGIPLRKKKTGAAFMYPSIPRYLVKAYRLRLIEAKDIAQKMGCSVTSAWKKLKVIDRIKAAPTRHILVYKAYKKGKSIAEISELFNLAESAVKIYIIKARRKDHKPYYRHKFRTEAS